MAAGQSHFIFVPTDPTQKPNNAQRSRIRRHCMRGKNTRKSDARLIAEGSYDDSLSFHPPLPPLPMVRPRSQQSGHVDHIEAVLPGLKSVHFADALDSNSLKLISTIFPGTMRAFSLSGFGIPSDINSTQWQDWLFSDVAYVHSITTVCSVIQDYLLQHHRSKTTLLYLRKAISIFNSSLSDSMGSPTDETLAVVVALSIAAVISKDHSAMVAHAAGLREMIRLRGGLDGFRGNPQLPIVLARIDLCLSLNIGHSPIWTTCGQIDIPHDFVKSSCASEYSVTLGPSLQEIFGEQLATVFRDMQYWAGRINKPKTTHQSMQGSDLHAGIWLAQYRLLQLQGTFHDSSSECLRMAMLAFLTTTFRVLGSRVPYKRGASQLRDLCCAIEVTTDQMRGLMFWILMIGLIAFFDHDEPWLRRRWQDISPAIQGMEWVDARRLLQDYIWIDICNDEPGEVAFEQMRQKG